MSIPEPVLAAAKARAAARAARDWPTADRLRAEIEAAGWRVVDRGTDFRLETAHPPDVRAEGEVRYGRSDSVPSRLEDPATAPATILSVIAGEHEGQVAALGRSLGAALDLAPDGVEAVVTADGLGDEARRELDDLVARLATGGRSVEVVATSAPLGHAAALNAGLRRARGTIVVVLDPSVEPRADVVGPLAAALADETVAVAGPFGLASTDLRRFEELVAPAEPLATAAIEGYVMAFRRADAAARGPLDERFRYYRNLDVWWSLVLRDEGPDRTPRRALVVPGLELRRGEPAAWSGLPEAERERRSKRNFYRLLERFRERLDLALPPPS